MTWIPERDSSGFALFKNQMAGTGWHYEPRGFDFYVGKYQSLYNRLSSGNGSIASATDYGDADLKFYDSSGVELTKGESETPSEFQTRLDSNCYMTDLIWSSTYDRKCIGATVQIKNLPNWSCYLWCDVDLTAVGLGLMPYLAGGLNLSMMQEGHPFTIDARTPNDDPLPAYIPLVFRVRHDLVNDSTRFGLQIFMEHYRE